MPSELDLTPFGFTATESLAYAALLRLGPSTGYAVAHAARVARANTYGALEGLVRRTAALRLPGRPARYRATDPTALIAQLAAQQGEALDRLSRSLRDAAGPSEPETRSVTGGPGGAAPPARAARGPARRGGARAALRRRAGGAAAPAAPDARGVTGGRAGANLRGRGAARAERGAGGVLPATRPRPPRPATS